MIDWTKRQSPASLAAAERAAWRAAAVLPVADFAIAAMTAGLLSEADAEAWVTGNATPGVVTAALASVPERGRTAARLKIRGATTVHRASPFVALLAAQMGLSEPQVDALFGSP